MTKKLIVKKLTVTYENERNGTAAIEELSFAVKENEFLCLVGPTGCGKTTVLNTIAGFLKPQKGQVLLEGTLIKKPTKEIGMVFQHHALFPWKTVRENLSIGPLLNNIGEEQRKKMLAHYLKLIGLTKYANYYPHELSGGMQQRVGVARALANNPKVVLMDEPFGSLDTFTRTKMQENLLDIWQKHKKTIIFVTHDIDEALILSDRILIMTETPGRIKSEIYNTLGRPRSYKSTTNLAYLKLKKQIIGLIGN